MVGTPNCIRPELAEAGERLEEATGRIEERQRWRAEARELVGRAAESNEHGEGRGGHERGGGPGAECEIVTGECDGVKHQLHGLGSDSKAKEVERKVQDGHLKTLGTFFQM